MISLGSVEPSAKLTTAAGMGEGKEGGGVTIYEDNNDGAALCFSEGGTAMECGEENVLAI